MARLPTELTALAVATMLVVNTFCQAAVSYVFPFILTVMVFATDTRLKKITMQGYNQVKRRWETPTERQQIEDLKHRISRLSNICATTFTLLETRLRNLSAKVDTHTAQGRTQGQTAGREEQADHSSDEETRPPRFLRVPNTEGPARNTRSKRTQKVTLKIRKNKDGNYETAMTNNPEQEQSFYFCCKLCLVELWLASPSMADLCIACRPRLHKRDKSFERIVDTSDEKLWFCCCPNCLEKKNLNCQVRPCQACTQWRGFVEPQEPDRIE
jgi:hypothetical protein